MTNHNPAAPQPPATPQLVVTSFQKGKRQKGRKRDKKAERTNDKKIK